MLKKIISCLCFVAALICLTACTTTVRTDVTRPAHLDIEKIDKVSVLPFKTSMEMRQLDFCVYPAVTFAEFHTHSLAFYRERDEEIDIVCELDRMLIDRMYRGTDFAFINPATVESAIYSGKKNPADVYITGGITQFSSRMKSKEVEETTKEGKKRKVKKFYRETDIDLVYQVVDAKTSKVISYDEYGWNLKSDSHKNKHNVPGAYEMVGSELDDFVSRIMRDFKPYHETKSFTLLKYKDDGMKQAAKIADKGQILTAAKKYKAIYDANGYFEAGYNAALLYEANGDYETALKIANELYSSTGDSRAKSLSKDIKSEINSKARLQKQRKK